VPRGSYTLAHAEKTRIVLGLLNSVDRSGEQSQRRLAIEYLISNWRVEVARAVPLSTAGNSRSALDAGCLQRNVNS
jgi:hypothetical protein